ncbi:hypothetical protein DIE19_12080 [Burkholderia sp. Bp9126]|nr:hypothetical protein DIE19_12080 [Burkholderia sp. Bp9126]
MSVTPDDPFFLAPIYARQVEDEGDTHDLIWSRRSQASYCPRDPKYGPPRTH